jgi:glycosyltransferase involved in cell wall biosynthesis
MISILCPTRGRPSNMRRLYESAYATSDTNLEFVFYIDDDDTESAAMAEELGVVTVVGPRIVLSEMWNKCYEVSSGHILMHCGDDIVFRSGGWDTLVLKAFNEVSDNILLVYGRDGLQDENLGTHTFMHRKWAETVGYFVPPYFSSDYNDTWLNDVAVSIGRRKYIPEIYTEHMHPGAGKSDWDKTHQERIARHQADRVDELYRSLIHEREADAAKLRAVMEQ